MERGRKGIKERQYKGEREYRREGEGIRERDSFLEPEELRGAGVRLGVWKVASPRKVTELMSAKAG